MARSRRRRIRPGYIACVACDRDLPVEEFKPVRHRCRDGRVTERPYSYCRRCASEMICAARKARRSSAGDAERARRRVVERRYYRRNEQRDRAADRTWRAQMAQLAIGRLRAAGWSLRRISDTTGLHRGALGRWRRGESVPWQRHVDALRALAGSLDAPDRSAA